MSYIELPINVGDTLYTNFGMHGWYLHKKKRPYMCRVFFIGINGVDNFFNVDFGNGRMYTFRFSDIGKFIFLTREEAEKDLNNKEE